MTAVADAARDVILRDGTTLRLRPPREADTDTLLEFFAGLSPESAYLRFHGVRHVSPKLFEADLDPDWVERGALVGTLGENGRVVALATYVRLRDPRTAEVAFAVEDELQGRGVGTRLLEQLAAEAAKHGVESFVAEVLPGNRPMMQVFQDAGFDVTRELAEGEVEVRFSIGPTEAYRERVDERDHIAITSSLRPFNKSRRPKPIPLARVELQLLREQLLARPRGTSVVFATEAGGVYSKSGFRAVWLPALLAAGLAHEEKSAGRTIIVADFRFHWLRHTAISLMARAGMKAELIAERVGHNDGGALIYRRYRHLFPSEVREAVSMLDRMVAKTAGSDELGGSTSGQ